jgi:ribonucleoside-diphosphate reductase alpha chain
VTFQAIIGGTTVYLTANRFPDGRCGEIFLRVSKSGSTLDGMIDAWAIMVSKALQYGVPLAKVVHLFSGRRSEPNGLTRDPIIPTCSSIQDYVVRRLAVEFLGEGSDQAIYGASPVEKLSPLRNGDDTTPGRPAGLVGSGQLCPTCGAELITQAGCLTCLPVVGGCGWSKCG